MSTGLPVTRNDSILYTDVKCINTIYLGQFNTMKYSYVKHCNIKNGVVTLYVTPDGTTAELDHQLLPDMPLKAEGYNASDALRSICDVLIYMREAYIVTVRHMHSKGVININNYCDLINKEPYYGICKEVINLIDKL